MRIFIAGATGAIGAQLIPQLVAKGHEVVGMTRSPGKADGLRELGARPSVADALDPDQVAQAVAEAEPEVIVHQLTALSDPMNMRHMDRWTAATNRLRIEGTDHLLAAGAAVGVRKFVAQSNSLFMERTGGMVKSEDAELDPNPPKALVEAVAAVRYLETSVTSIQWGAGIALRYGGFYGPGTSLSADPDADMVAPVRKRQFPIVGGGTGVWSLVHIADAASATVAAIERGTTGIYHVADDEPAPVRDWLPGLAERFDAKPPRRVPRWVGRMLAGEVAALMMTEMRGISNEKAKRELDWRPQYPNWRLGFAKGLE